MDFSLNDAILSQFYPVAYARLQRERRWIATMGVCFAAVLIE
jgi:hypothetical protein